MNVYLDINFTLHLRIQVEMRLIISMKVLMKDIAINITILLFALLVE